MSHSAIRFLLVLVLVVGVGIRFYHLTDRSIWFDESFTWRLNTFSLPEIIERTAADVHPPLYYVILHGWSFVFGASLFSLRSFSVVMGVLTGLGAYAFAKEAFRSPAAGLFAALFVSVSAWQIPFSWEARMYTFGTALTLLSATALIKAVRNNTLRYWVLYGLSLAALLYTHYYTVFIIAAQLIWLAAYVLIWTKWKLVWQAVVALTIAAALFLPWVPTFLKQTSRVQTAYWIPPVNRWSVPDTIHHMFIPTRQGLAHHTAGQVMVALLPVVFTGLMWVAILARPPRRQSESRDAAWLCALCFALPFSFSMLVSFVTQSVYQERYFVFSHVFLLIGLAAFVMIFPRRWWRTSLVTILVAGSLVAYGRYWQALDFAHKPGLQAAVRQIWHERQSNELVISGSSFIFLGVDHYATEEFKAPQSVKLYTATPPIPHFAGGPVLRQQDLFLPADVVASAVPVIWVVDTTGFGGQLSSLPGQWVLTQRRSYPEVFDYQGEVIVSKYEKNTVRRR